MLDCSPYAVFLRNGVLKGEHCHHLFISLKLMPEWLWWNIQAALFHATTVDSYDWAPKVTMNIIILRLSVIILVWDFLFNSHIHFISLYFHFISAETAIALKSQWVRSELVSDLFYCACYILSVCCISVFFVYFGNVIIISDLSLSETRIRSLFWRRVRLNAVKCLVSRGKSPQLDLGL